MAEQLEAIIEETIFRNEENGYSVVQAKAGRESVTVVGALPALAPGEQVSLSGGWVEHPQYGKQWKATACEIRQPTTLLGIERYLGSGLIKGVGPSTARLLVQEFGKRTLDVLSEQPERLTEVPGIGKKRAAQLAESFREQYAAREAMVFLQSYGVSPALAVKISKAYGADAQRKIRENPYRLIDDIEGVGFLTADRIALSLGIPQDSEFRLRSGLKYVLQESANGEGHTYLPRELLLERAARALRVDAEQLLHPLDALLFARELVAVDAEGRDAVMLSAYFYAEKETARYLRLLLRDAPEKPRPSLSREIGEFEKRNGIQFSENQRRAVSEAVRQGLMVITGGPGTGKTTIINCILSLVGKDALLAAPTGRAAKRMSETSGREARTIHRLLEYSPQEDGFARNEDNPLACGLLVVDEASMMDTLLFYHLLKAVPMGATVVLVGDVHQLPSVGPGNVLADIIASGAVPVVELTEIFRQSAESEIICNAHLINKGQVPSLESSKDRLSDFYFIHQNDPERAADMVVDLVRNHIPRRFGLDPVNDIQVLTPMHKGAVGAAQLNLRLQASLNPNGLEVRRGERSFRLHDKVMQIRNNYDKDVFNGDVGRIVFLDGKERTLSVRYDDRVVPYDFEELDELTPAYAISIHKSQGSEYPAVVIPLMMQHYVLLQRNLVYTGVTRGKKLVVLVGESRALHMAVKNNKTRTRHTRLALRLQPLT